MKRFKSFLSIIAFASILSILNAQTPDYYFTNFNSGIPSGFKMLDLDDCEINEDYYRNVKASRSWSANKIEAVSNFAAMSFSRVDEGEIQQSNWIISPKVAITSINAYVRWDARSLLKAFPEKYRVMISTTDSKSTSFIEIASIEAEEYDWTTRLVSLKDFLNQEIYVAFVCESTNKYILAIDNLTIGELTDEKIVLTDSSPRYCGDEGEVVASGQIFNAGANLDWLSLIATTSEGNQEIYLDDFSTNSEIDFEFKIPVEVGKQSKYILSAKKKDGALQVLLSDSIICSYFKRNLLVDKTTGTWCNNCPEGELFMKPIKKRYAGSLVTINSHYNDPMACIEYFAGLNQWIFNLPTTITNRDRKTITNISYGKYDYSLFNTVLTKETIAQVSATATINEDASAVEISSIVEFAQDIDNSLDNYKLGYALVENQVYNPEHFGFKQQNNSTMPKASEYYIMPTEIPQDIMVYEDVVREGSTAFSGVDNSLPNLINSFNEITSSYSISIPKQVVDKTNLDAIVFILNKETDIIMNTVRIPCLQFNSIENGALFNNNHDLKIYGNGICKIEFSDINNKFMFEAYSADGRLLKQTNGIASEKFEIDLSQYKGLIFVKITQNKITTIHKAIIK